MYFVRYGGGGSDVFRWSFFSLEVIPRPPLSHFYNVILSESLGRHNIISARVLVALSVLSLKFMSVLYGNLCHGDFSSPSASNIL